MKKLIILLISGFLSSCQMDIDHNPFTFDNFNPKLKDKDNIVEGSLAKIEIDKIKTNYETNSLTYTLGINSSSKKYYLNDIPILDNKEIKIKPNKKNVISFLVPNKDEDKITLKLSNSKDFEIEKVIPFLIKENEHLTVTTPVMEGNKKYYKFTITYKEFTEGGKYSIKIDKKDLKGKFEISDLEKGLSLDNINKKSVELKYNKDNNDTEGCHLIKVTLTDNDTTFDYHLCFYI